VDQFDQFVSAILARRRELPAPRAVLVGARLQTQGVNAAAMGVDGWLNLPQVRFNRESPAEHFYHHAMRLEEMFERLVFPLRDHRSLSLEMDFTEETATAYRRRRYEFREVDVVIVEGVFLLKRACRRCFDLSCWVDCSFETALERAIQRAQEGLSPTETIRVFETIYHPAQQIHFERDNPRAAADFILRNDPKLTPVEMCSQAA